MMKTIQNLGKVNAPVCGPYALALVANVPLEQAMATVKRVKGAGDRWKGRSTLGDLMGGLATFRVFYDRLTGLRGKALKTVACDDLNFTKQHLIFITDHFVTLYRGLVYDQAHPEGVHYTQYSLRNRRVKAVLMIH